jgi:RNA recognition motif-containing protein
MSKKLYVGNLPFDTTEEQLNTTFGACGAVASSKIIMDKYTGRSRGFGFVEMTNDAEADVAVQKLNGSSMGPRQIVVNEARPMEERGPGGGNSRGGGGSSGGGFRRGGFNR